MDLLLPTYPPSTNQKPFPSSRMKQPQDSPWLDGIVTGHRCHQPHQPLLLSITSLKLLLPRHDFWSTWWLLYNQRLLSTISGFPGFQRWNLHTQECLSSSSSCVFFCSFFLRKYGDQWPFPPNKLIQISRSLDPRSAADAQSTLQALGWKFPAPMAMAPNHLHTGKLLGLKQQKMVHLCHKQ